MTMPVPFPRRVWGTYRRIRVRRRLSSAVVVILVASTLVVTPVVTRPRPAAAAELPAGGLVDSVADFGRTQGTFSVTGDGAAVYSVPMWMPEGRGGRVAPTLSLDFHSNRGNGLLGVGWSLSGLSSITWCARTMAQDGYTEGGHTNGSDPLCLDGNRLIPVTRTGQPEQTLRTERETFARITAFGMEDGVPTHLRVETRDGLIKTYGQTSDSRMTGYRLPRDGSPQVSVTWALNKVEDRNGNSATVEYHQVKGDEAAGWFVDMRPKVIRYEPNRRVEFAYADNRPDVLDGFQRGVRTRTTHRLQRIDMFGGPVGGTAERLRQYQLSYLDADHDSITGRSLLSRIVECDGRGVCKKPLDLDWSKGGYGIQHIDTEIGDFSQTGASDRLIAGDVDGNGRDDIVYRHRTLGWRIHRSVGDGSATRFDAGAAAGIPTTSNTLQQMRPIDFDRDGRMDIMAEVPDDSTGGTGWKLYRSNGATFVEYSNNGQNIGYFGRNDDELDPVYFADVSGDGLPDFITARWDNDSGTLDRDIDGPWRIRLNRGTDAGGRFAPEIDTGRQVPATPDRNRVLDTDGDGRAELVGEDNVPYPDKKWYALGLSPQGTVEAPESTLTHLNDVEGIQQHFGDVNGDGLADHISKRPAIRQGDDDDPVPVSRGQMSVRLSSGDGVGLGSLGTTNFDTDEQENADHVVDFDNDGRDDVLSFRTHPLGADPEQNGAQLFVWRNGSLERAGMPELLVESNYPYDGDDPLESDFSRYRWRYTLPLDVDGNGVTDIVTMKNDSLHILRRTDPMPDRLTGIGAYGLGPRVEVTYTTLSDPIAHVQDGGCSYPLVCPTSGGNVVSQHQFATYENAPANWDRYTHVYTRGRVDVRGRGWLGFSSHSVTRSVADTAVSSTVTEYDNTAADGGTDGVSLVYPGAHVPRKVTTTVGGLPAGGGVSGSRTRRSTVTTDNVLRRFDSRRYTVEPRTVVATEEERLNSGAWQTLRSSTTGTAFDAFGNPDLRVVATVGGSTVVEDPTFSNDETGWLIGMPTRTSTSGCTADSRCKTRVTTLGYYPNGNLKETVVEPDDPLLKLTTTATYTAVGGAPWTLTATDGTGRSRKTTFEYTDDFVHPRAVVDALDHRTETQVHSGLGVPLATTGANPGEKVTMRYDRFGRLRETTRADGSFERASHSTFFGLDIVSTEQSGGGYSQVLTDWFDREFERRVRASDGRTAHTFTDYDPFGRVTSVSRPMYVNATRYDTTTEYDRLGRPTKVVAPDGATVRHEYIGLETHTYDARNVHSYTVANNDGQVASSFEYADNPDDPAPGVWLKTTLGYDAFGLPRTTTAPDGTVQTLEYDQLGHRTSMTDPSAGTTTNTYTAFGEVGTETDGANRTTTYEYDALGRVTKLRSPDGHTTYTWDTAPNGIGKLHSVDSPDNVFTRYQYNEIGQRKVASWKIRGETFEIATSYDGLGRTARVTYPHVFLPEGYDRLQVEYVYNANGYLSRIRDTAANGPVYWQVPDDGRNTAGQLTREILGNGVTGTREYQPETGLLKKVTATGPGTVGRLSELSYSHDGTRNVTSRQDPVNNRQETYRYDTLNRMTAWTLGATTTNFTYDNVGNLKTETAPGRSTTYHYGENGAPPHALTGLDNDHTRFVYDAAGQQVTAMRRAVEYTTKGLPKAVTYGQNQIRREFDYDADGVRVRKDDVNKTLVTVSGLFERSVAHPGGEIPPDARGVHNVHNIVAEGRVVAQVVWKQDTVGGTIVSRGVQYPHTDALGSTVAVSAGGGSPVSSFFYDPWGQRTDIAGRPTSRNEGQPRQGFTGHEHDDDLGLINAKGRIYDPAHRRFLSPDPVVTDPSASQSLNRYVYVQNNPATRTDPTGLTCGSCDPGYGPSPMDVYQVNPGTYVPEIVVIYQPGTEKVVIINLAALKADDDLATTPGPTAQNKVCKDCAGTPDSTGRQLRRLSRDPEGRPVQDTGGGSFLFANPSEALDDVNTTTTILNLPAWMVGDGESSLAKTISALDKTADFLLGTLFAAKDLAESKGPLETAEGVGKLGSALALKYGIVMEYAAKKGFITASRVLLVGRILLFAGGVGEVWAVGELAYELYTHREEIAAAAHTLSNRTRETARRSLEAFDRYIAPAILDIGLQLQGSSLKEVQPPWVRDAELGNTDRYLPNGDRDLWHR